MAIRVMLIEPKQGRRAEIERALRAEGFEVLALERPPAPGPTALKGSGPVLLAVSASAPEQVAGLQASDPLVPVVVYGEKMPDPELAMALARARAYDFLLLADAGDLPRLRHRLEAAVERQEVRSSPTDVASEIIGVSEKAQQVRRHVGLAAASNANVLITGESGTGKELVAQAIHHHSSRSAGPFIAVNCAAIPENLLESELFGHERGAFTGAERRKPGHFESADGGTLFFDEIGEMPGSLQAKLLRVLQPPAGRGETVREFTRVGGDAPQRSDVRLVFATNRELDSRVREGAFREDLHQRMNVVRIHVPPLRERREDVPLLAQRFLERHARREGLEGLAFDPLVLGVLQQYDFPSNVRQLDDLAHSIVVLKEAGSTVVLGDLPPEICRVVEAVPSPSKEPPLERTLAAVIAEHVTRVMAHCQGNKSRAARVLGLSRPALDRRLAALESNGSTDPD